MKPVKAKAPTRVDIGGGTLDITPLHQILDEPVTINFGVTLDAEADIEAAADGRYYLVSEDQKKTVSGSFAEVTASRELPLLGLMLKNLWRSDLPAIRLTTRAGSPSGAGLGGSSCLGIAIYGALSAMRAQKDPLPRWSDERIVQIVQDTETRLIHAPTGCQDYWGGLKGNFNIITYPPGGTVVETINAHNIKELQDGLVLCFTGQSRASADNNWKIFRATFEGNKDVLASLNKIARTVQEMAAALRKGQWARVVELSSDEWQVRKKLWPDIVTAATSRMEEAALKAGARFARLCGAGGGGVMAVFVPRDKRIKVCEALQAAGGTILDGQVADYGLTVH